MKKLVLALLLGTCLSSEAFADCNGFYLAGRGGVVQHKYSGKGDFLSKNDLDKNRLMLSGALGYRHDYFRTELEYVWRDKSHKTYGEPGATGRTSFKSYSYMLNGYFDFAPYRWFTPYVSAGIGFTKMKYSDKYELDGTINSATNNGNYEPTRFTWSVGGGLSVKVTNRFNVDAGYRYYDMGSIRHADVDAHEIYGGLRYVF